MGRNALQCVVVGRTLHRLHSLQNLVRMSAGPVNTTRIRTMSLDIPPLKSYRSTDDSSATSGGKVFNENGKIFELRQYNCSPGGMPEYLRLTRELLHLRIRHSKLFGFWTSELGGLNQSFHIWEYDNLDHRAQVRQSLANDKEWNDQYLSKARHSISSQDNSVLIPFTWSPLVEPTNDGAYEMQMFNMSEHIEVWHDRLKKAMLFRQKALEQYDTKLLGVFYTLFGRQNSVVALWKHNTLTQATQGKVAILTEAKDPTMTAFYHEVGRSYSQALLPFEIKKS